MSSTHRRKKWLKRTLIGVVGLLAVAFIAFKLIGLDEARQYVIDRVEKRTNGRYSLILEDLDFSLWGGNLHLGNGKLQRDHSVDTYTGTAFLDKFDIDAEFTSLDVSTFKLILFLLTQEIDVYDMSLVDPRLVITKNQDFSADSSAIAQMRKEEVLADSTALEELKEATREFFPPITVEALNIENGSFEFYGGIVDYPIQMVDGVNLNLTGLYYEDGKNNYSADKLDFRVDTAGTLLSKNTARLTVGGVQVTKDTVHINHLHYGHIVSPDMVNRFKGFRASWLDVQVQHLDLPKLDLESMAAEQAVILPKLEIADVQLKLRKDKRDLRINPAYKALPHELLRDIPVPIFLDSLIVQNAFLDIEMLAPKAIQYGKLTIDTAHLLVTNITNIPDRLSANENMRLRLDAKVNKFAPASAEFNFDLDSPDEEYTCALYAGPMDATLLNNFIGSQFFIEFKSGYVRRLDLRYNGNKRANTGELDFEYQNLRIRKLQNADEFVGDSKTHRGFLAWLGNVIVSNDHTADMKKYKTSLVYYEREFNRDFLHGMVMSLLSGITGTLGFGMQNEEKVQKKLDSLDDTDMAESALKAQDKADAVDRKKEKERKKDARQQQKADKKKKKNGGKQ